MFFVYMCLWPCLHCDDVFVHFLRDITGGLNGNDQGQTCQWSMPINAQGAVGLTMSAGLGVAHQMVYSVRCITKYFNTPTAYLVNVAHLFVFPVFIFLSGGCDCLKPGSRLLLPHWC